MIDRRNLSNKVIIRELSRLALGRVCVYMYIAIGYEGTN